MKVPSSINPEDFQLAVSHQSLQGGLSVPKYCNHRIKPLANSGIIFELVSQISETIIRLFQEHKGVHSFSNFNTNFSISIVTIYQTLFSFKQKCVPPKKQQAPPLTSKSAGHKEASRRQGHKEVHCPPMTPVVFVAQGEHGKALVETDRWFDGLTRGLMV